MSKRRTPQPRFKSRSPWKRSVSARDAQRSLQTSARSVSVIQAEPMEEAAPVVILICSPRAKKGSRPKDESQAQGRRTVPAVFWQKAPDGTGVALKKKKVTAASDAVNCESCRSSTRENHESAAVRSLGLLQIYADTSHPVPESTLGDLWPGSDLAAVFWRIQPLCDSSCRRSLVIWPLRRDPDQPVPFRNLMRPAWVYGHSTRSPRTTVPGDPSERFPLLVGPQGGQEAG